MVQYSTYGLDTLRSYVYNNFNWLAILNDSGTELIRWDLINNSNVTLDSDASNNPVQYTITITGGDLENAGYSLPQTLETGELYETNSSTDDVGTDSL